ncbi:MAG: ribonuclease III [Gammaproteobacteria bacterium]|nr:ribonuclease III [Gammaproteobacteria bacterium]MDH4313524.1 ribonuclease III [Gammaproteobacteria bacterium]MDH5212593.1 ribonuclease III [Gammaproteobacteria bacterium]MDH5500541.1 ribonuclease III [Gammaproteobacteria bacterium]
MDKAARWLKKSLNYEFRDVELLRYALTHRSATGRNNERLEYLGDAVLDTVISEIIFHARPEADEGDLSRLRSYLVKDSALSELATELGIGRYVVLGPGEKKTGGHRRESILADALEALFGAVYLDSGFEAAKKLICTAYGERLNSLPNLNDLRDPKTALQEFLQGRQLALPEYNMEKITGKAHQQMFEVSCTVAEHGKRSLGIGGSRRDAEQQAAEKMLAMLESEA